MRLLAKSISHTHGRRVVWTIYHACLDYCGLKILYSCITSTDAAPSRLEGVLSELLGIAHKALNEDPQHVYRYAWPLRMAILKSTDPVHRDWLLIQIKKASTLLSNLGIPADPFEVDATNETLFLEHNKCPPTSRSRNSLG